jgi:hypothetical protein
LGQRQIGLCGDPADQLRLRLNSGMRLASRLVTRTLGLPTAVPLRRNLLGPAKAHNEPFRQLLKRSRALIIGQQ